MVTVLFDAITPRAMEYVKFRQSSFDSDSNVIFRFVDDYDLALALLEASRLVPSSPVNK